MINKDDFIAILKSFADKQSDVQFDKGSFLASIRGVDIIGKLYEKEGQLYVEESKQVYPIREWIIERLADLRTLAERIIEYIPFENELAEKDFIDPCGAILEDVDKEKPINSVTHHLHELLNDTTFGTTKIVYLTSDAGEGKTTIINYMSVQQARLFLDKKEQWLMIPIPLLGRKAVRFDDIIVGSLMNRLKFRSFYSESFIQLIKHNFIIPAFDGFEEMFIAGSMDAISSTGNLISELNSFGTLLFATRKAYFEYKGFQNQAKLFDSFNNNSVDFNKITICRWNKSKFLEFATKKNIQNPEHLYTIVLNKLGDPEHPLLTRPFLVNKLITIYKDYETDEEKLLQKLTNTATYFINFIDAIIEREANTKWVDFDGEVFKPILTINEHYILLSLIAENMWDNSIDELSEQYLYVICDLLNDYSPKPPKVLDQVKERIKQHALILSAHTGQKLYKFDHEEFKNFFLGIALSENINSGNYLSVITMLKKSKLPDTTIDVFINKVNRDIDSIEKLMINLNSNLSNETILSSIKENISKMALNLINDLPFEKTLNFNSYLFPSNSLENISLNNVCFENCYFTETSLDKSAFSNCSFLHCSFNRIEIDTETVYFNNVIFDGNSISCIFNLKNEISIYAPEQIESFLIKCGIIIPSQNENSAIIQDIVIDEELEIFEKVIRRFMRTNPITENIIKLKLGAQYKFFEKNVLPELLRSNIIEDLGNISQKKYKLKVKFLEIDIALKKCNGSFRELIKYFEK